MEFRAQDMLRSKFAERVASNRSYSLRSFARDLQLDPGFLSYLMSGKRKLSLSRAFEVSRRLKLGSDESQMFLAVVQAENKPGSELAEHAISVLATLQKPKGIYQKLSLDIFALISEWYHYAILELSLQDRVRLSPQSIAKRLGITTSEAKLALDRLLKLGLLQERNGRLCKSDRHISPSGQIASTAIRKRHSQILEKAMQALRERPIEEREFQSITMSIDPSLLPEAKRRIQSFAWELCELLESKGHKEIYEFSMQLFSLEKKDRSRAL